jgi:hypothetical protein
MAGKQQNDGEKVVEQSARAVQENVDEANDQGFLGEAVDKTPRQNYTVQGVTSGAETPESTELEKQ